jgi:hypothetical protein
LHFVELLFRSRQPVLVGAEGECPGLNMLEIFTNSRKEALPHVFAAEPVVAVPMISVIIARATIAIVPTTTIRVISEVPIAVIAPVISPVHARLSARIWRRSLTTGISGAAPGQIEGISFRTIVRIFDANYRWAAIARVAHQCLPPSAIHARKTEVARICGQRSGTLESPPLRRRAFQVP